MPYERTGHIFFLWCHSGHFLQIIIFSTMYGFNLRKEDSHPSSYQCQALKLFHQASYFFYLSKYNSFQWAQRLFIRKHPLMTIKQSVRASELYLKCNLLKTFHSSEYKKKEVLQGQTYNSILPICSIHETSTTF